MLSTKSYTGPREPNDDRSDSLNKNNDAYKNGKDNHGNQQNPNNKRYDGKYNSSK